MDDMDVTMGILRMAPAFAAMLPLLAGTVLFVPLVLYIVARWRANREPHVDPQLGAKFALHFFASIGLQLGLAGLMMLLFTMIRPGEGKSEEYRVAFGMIVPAGLLIALHVGMLTKTTDAQLPNVRRLFTGYNLFCVGIIGFFAVVLGFQVLFAKGSQKPFSHFVGAMVLVYCPAWGVLGWRLSELVKGDRSGGGAASPPMRMPEPIMPASTSSTQLPSLGGGAYPPIDGDKH